MFKAVWSIGRDGFNRILALKKRGGQHIINTENHLPVTVGQREVIRSNRCFAF